jgi:hypothetical protein
MEMQKFPNIRGLTEPLLLFEDDFEENGLVAGSYDTLVNTIEHKEKTTTFFGKDKETITEERHYINPIYYVCPSCGLISKFVDKKDMKKLFPNNIEN